MDVRKYMKSLEGCRGNTDKRKIGAQGVRRKFPLTKLWRKVSWNSPFARLENRHTSATLLGHCCLTFYPYTKLWRKARWNSPFTLGLPAHVCYSSRLLLSNVPPIHSCSKLRHGPSLNILSQNHVQE
jgi:hypothetical protein